MLTALNDESLAEFNEQVHKSGIVYISRIPRFMTPAILKGYLAPFGELGRVFLTPLPSNVPGKKKSKKFKDGWIEFKNKKHAKMAVMALNGSIMGGKKSSRFYDEIWSIKYLSKTKWSDLSTRKIHDRTMKEHRVQMEIVKVKKENNLYVKNVYQAEKIEKAIARNGSVQDESVKLTCLKEHFGQRKPLNKFE